MNKPDKNPCTYWSYVVVKTDNKNEHDKWINYTVILQKASAKRQEKNQLIGMEGLRMPCNLKWGWADRPYWEGDIWQILPGSEEWAIQRSREGMNVRDQMNQAKTLMWKRAWCVKETVLVEQEDWREVAGVKFRESTKGHVILGLVGHFKDFSIYSERNEEPKKTLKYGLICFALCINQDCSSSSIDNRS